jgi:hypothetical protein
VKYFIDGRKVADEDLVSAWKDLCDGINPAYPKQIEKIQSGQNMVGYLTNINAYGRILTNKEMSKVTRVTRNTINFPVLADNCL